MSSFRGYVLKPLPSGDCMNGYFLSGKTREERKRQLCRLRGRSLERLSKYLAVRFE